MSAFFFPRRGWWTVLTTIHNMTRIASLEFFFFFSASPWFWCQALMAYLWLFCFRHQSYLVASSVFVVLIPSYFCFVVVVVVVALELDFLVFFFVVSVFLPSFPLFVFFVFVSLCFFLSVCFFLFVYFCFFSLSCSFLSFCDFLSLDFFFLLSFVIFFFLVLLLVPFFLTFYVCPPLSPLPPPLIFRVELKEIMEDVMDEDYKEG